MKSLQITLAPLLLVALLSTCRKKEAVQEEPATITQEEIELGAHLFVDHGCAGCHGESGAGNSETARAIGAIADLRSASSYSNGSSVSQIAESIRTGINRTPMPPYPHLTQAERRALAAFLVQLRTSQP